MRISAKRNSGTTASYLERVNRAIDHVVGHLGEPLRLRELAQAALISPFHFHRVFQVVVGETPADFVKRLRLEKALGMMSSPDPPSLTAIALACGFSSSSDFSRCFKQRFAVAPRAFDIQAWRDVRGGELDTTVAEATRRIRPKRLPSRVNPDRFVVRIREIAARTVAYIRVTRPYRGGAVVKAAERLVTWAERQGLADGQWLGYQWDNPEITSLDDCQYYVAVEVNRFTRKGEIGAFQFPPMVVAEVEVVGGIDLELRALRWLYGSWLPRSRFVPDDHPGFEAWNGKPFAHGTEHFELRVQLPIREA